MTGKYRHGIDSKGRLAIPARLRDELGAAFYVTIGIFVLEDEDAR